MAVVQGFELDCVMIKNVYLISFEGVYIFIIYSLCTMNFIRIESFIM